MDLYYIPDANAQRATLQDDEFRHATKVMRLKEGSPIYFTNGKGNFFEGTILSMGKRSADINVIKVQGEAPAKYRVTLCIAITKNMKRIEWLVEKVTELGIHRVVPLICERSERPKANVERLRKISIAAMKQSQRANLPRIDDLTSFEDFIESASRSTTTRLIATQSDQSNGLKHNYHTGTDVVIAIGPEGDFTQSELELALEGGFNKLHLGGHRLRTETAGLFAVASIHTINQLQ